MRRKTTWTILILALLVLAAWGGHRAFVSLRPAIGVIEIDGVITDSMPYLDAIKSCGRDGSIKAVVVRLDSPGGKVGPSQEIHSALLDLKKKKPVVASLGSLGASGAYYIACAADEIYALPGTMTGSIGVIMEFFDASEGLRRIGLSSTSVTSGALKDAGSPFRRMTEAERAYFRGLVDDVHIQFVEAVCQARKMRPETVKPLADGRVFTGRQAKRLGLVDRLGGLDDAVKDAAAKAHIQGEPAVERFAEGDVIRGILRRILPWNRSVCGVGPELLDGVVGSRGIRLEYSMP